MDKNAIKKYAVWARRELIARVSQKAEQYGITEKNIGDIRAESVNGHLLTQAERSQRAALIDRIRQNGFQQVMEEVAYTWFNRFCALRFMEVNNYLPTRIRVFTDEDNAFKPQILTEAIHMEMDGLDMDKVYQLKSDNKTEELYKYLLITQCNALYSILPGMFQQIADYTELLLPDNLLREGSVIEQMITLIPEKDWLVPEDRDKDSIQIIGWLYQYYNAEPKDQVFANLKKNSKISKHDIPAATQLFTPDWIVRYMVENSLGRLWVEGHPDDELKAGWKYYLEEAEQEPDVQAQLAKIREEYATIKPEDIKCIDPCMGSGHILVYMFDVLVQIYQAYGYSTREAVQSIVENNLYGLDIDDRAAQLAYFAVMMKARQYDRRFFTRNIQPHICAIQESTKMPEEAWGYFGPEQDIAHHVYAAFVDAKEYGSLIEPNVTLEELDALTECLIQKRTDLDLADKSTWISACNILFPLIKQARMLVQSYEIVITNPPYMGGGTMGPRLDAFVKSLYPNSKTDLYTVFMERCDVFCQTMGFKAMITQNSWMFLSTYEALRKQQLQDCRFINMVHLGPHAFDEISGEVVQTTSFVSSKATVPGYCGSYKRLVHYLSEKEKKLAYLESSDLYITDQTRFQKIPCHPVAYWASENYYRIFDECCTMIDVATPKQGFATTDNDRFLRMWYEVSRTKMTTTIRNVDDETGDYVWVPYNKGGPFVKWYGNMDYVCNWKDKGHELRTHKKAVLRNMDYQFRRCITWSLNNFGSFGARERPDGSLFDTNGMSLFAEAEDHYYLLAFLSSKLASYFMKICNPTMSSQVGDIARLPVYARTEKKSEVTALAIQCTEIAKHAWDSFESSWDYLLHPIVQKAMSAVHWNSNTVTVEDCFNAWVQETESRFRQLKATEEEINRLFIEIYGLQNELTPEVEDKDITVRKADLGRDIRSFISYAVGCMFGRYSLDIPGLILAGQKYESRFVSNLSGYSDGIPTVLAGDYIRCADDSEDIKVCTYMPDKDGILPISDDEYFDDDIVGRFVRFVEVVYGKDALEENLAFIAKALGGSGTPRDVIRSYFLNDFYADHLKIYQKRPIYWLFDSGKKNGFKALIYMHRYAPDTIARIRTDYVHEQQSRYRTAIADLENRIVSASTSERVKLTKQLNKVKAQAEELRVYEEKIHHLADQMIAIDLDDGVKVNYAKFADVLAKIK